MVVARWGRTLLVFSPTSDLLHDIADLPGWPPLADLSGWPPRVVVVVPMHSTWVRVFLVLYYALLASHPLKVVACVGVGVCMWVGVGVSGACSCCCCVRRRGAYLL